jgi:hypothetical protein
MFLLVPHTIYNMPSIYVTSIIDSISNTIDFYLEMLSTYRGNIYRWQTVQPRSQPPSHCIVGDEE